EADASGLRLQLTRQHVDDGALPGPVVADEAVYLSRSHREGDVVDREGVAEPEGQPVHREGGVTRVQVGYALLHRSANSSRLSAVTRSSFMVTTRGGFLPVSRSIVYSTVRCAMVPGSSVAVP